MLEYIYTVKFTVYMIGMARSLLTEDDLEEFRGRLVEVAIRCFADRGYDAVTMRGLAKELGVSAMTPYRYIANKQALMRAVRAESFRRFADRQHQAVVGIPITNPTERLLRLKQAYVEFAIEQPHAYRIMFALDGGDADDDEHTQREGARAFSYLFAATEAAVANGELDGDPLTVAHLLWANTHGLVMLHLAGRLTNGRTLSTLATVALELPRAKRKSS